MDFIWEEKREEVEKNWAMKESDQEWFDKTLCRDCVMKEKNGGRS